MTESDDPMERYFEAGRRTAPAPSEALLARIEADGLVELDRRLAATARAHEPGGFGAILAVLGGWRAGAGLATAAFVGIVLGVSLESGLGAFGGLAAGAAGYELGDFAPGYGVALLEDG